MSKPYTQPGEKGTDTNQASEDELKTKASDSSSEAGYTIIPELYEYCLGAGLKLSNYQAIELTKLIQKLIRTEKLKLLDRLSSHQEDLFWWTGGEYEKTKAVDMRAIAAERELLTKLEAEL